MNRIQEAIEQLVGHIVRGKRNADNENYLSCTTIKDLTDLRALLEAVEADMAYLRKQIADLQAEIKCLEGGWGRVHDIELIEQLRQALITDELLANEAIALTPDIEKRKILTDVNILRMAALAAAEKEKYEHRKGERSYRKY